MTWLDKIVDPNILRNLPLGEKAMASLYMALLGMGVTFIALGIVWGAVIIFTRVLRAGPGRRKFEPPVSPPFKPLLLLQEDDEEGEVAAIVAALVMTLTSSAGTFRVRKIRRTEDRTPSWGQAGRMEELNSSL